MRIAGRPERDTASGTDKEDGRQEQMATNNRNTGWKDAPAAGDLAALVKCEREYVHARQHGEVLTARREETSRAGKAEHDRTELAMARHHNSPRPKRTGQAAPSAPDKRCFVASAVYGIDAPQTSQLRAFRDRVLKPRRAGRLVIATYYALSPFLVRLLLRAPCLLPTARHGLDWIRSWSWVRGSQL